MKLAAERDPARDDADRRAREPEEEDLEAADAFEPAALGRRVGGAPVDPPVRSAVEERLGVDLGHVRIHTGRESSEAARAIGARAFTQGSDVVLGAGESPSDTHLMAHELVHVAQQRSRGSVPQRQTDVGPAGDPAEVQADAVADEVASALIVDGSTASAGQIDRATFMRELEAQVTAAADEELGPLWSAAGCPYIQSFFEQHRTTDAARLERMAKLYSGLSTASAARDYYAPIVARVRDGVRRWRAGGDVGAELASVGMGDASDAARDTAANAARLETSGGSVQRTPDGSGTALRGRPLDGAIRSRMEGAIGADLSRVRIHSGPAAEKLTTDTRSLAVAAGNDIAFASNRYRPGTIVGDALLAHELAHVVQQDGAVSATSAGSQEGAAERDADATAIDALVRLHGPSGLRTSTPARRPRVAGPLTLRRCSSDRPTTLPGADRDGRFEGQAVGYRDVTITGDMFSRDSSIALEAADTLGFHESEDAALAMAAAGGANGGAVTLENGEYVAYRVFQEIPTERPQTTMESMSGIQDRGVRIVGGVVALVTADGAILRPGDPGILSGTSAASQDPFSAEHDPFAGFREAFGDEDQSLAGLERDQLILAFDAALRANALNVLAHSEREVQAKQQLLGGGTGSVSAGEISHIRATLTDLIEIQTRLDEASTRAAGLGPLAGPPLPIFLAPKSGAGTIDYALQGARDKERITRERAYARARYPVLARYSTLASLQALAALGDEALLQELGSKMPGILESITDTRNNVLNGKLNLWSIPSLIDSTIAGLGITDSAQRGWITSEKESRAAEEMRDSLILAAFSIGFAVGAIFVSGPAGVALAAGAFGLGAYDAIRTTDQYFVQQDASNTHLDPAMSLLPPELAAGWGWLVVAWVGVLLDAGDVAQAIGRSVRAVGQGTRSISAAADELAAASGATGDEAAELTARLRRAAGDFDADDVITHANKGALANRIGTNIEIDASLPAGEVRILYRIDDLNNIEVLGCRAHPAALAADVAAHAGVVQLLRRYDGVIGRFRQLWDRFREVFGVTTGAPPSSLERGSAAWESFHELGKHRELIAGRTSRLGSTVTAAEEGALRADVEFFESEYAHHARVVQQASTEAGSGFIASAGRRSREALAAGYKLPGLENVAPTEITDEMLQTCDYYYRAGDAAGQFVLVKKAGRNAPSLRGLADGTFTAGDLTRAERAAELLSSWTQSSREAFEELADGLRAAGARLVPVRGISATTSTMGDVITARGPANFRAAFLQILVEAQTRRGVAADAAAAAAQADLDRLLAHNITVIQGTDQLRAFGYRANFVNVSGTTLAAGEDLHHLIPLYLGGSHLVDNFVRLQEDLHQRMHRLIDEIGFDEATTLAPHSIQRANLAFGSGAAILHADGRIEVISVAEVVRRAAQTGGGG